MSEKSNQNKKKARVFTAEIYPDSAPADWLDRAKATHLDMLISPIHDKDTNPDKTPKKPHYHIMALWDSPTTFNNAKNILSNIGVANGHIEYVESTPGMARYLIHRDNPEKAQYDADDVVVLGAIDYEEICNKVQDKRKHIGEMTEYIRDNAITSFAAFAYHCQANEPQWFNILTDKNTLYIKTLIDANWKDMNGYSDEVN